MNVVRYVMPALCAAVLFACNHERDQGSTTVTGASAASVPNARAVSQIADRQCAREVVCNNIGADRRYVSRDACVQKTNADTMSDLNVNDCPAGISQEGLDACVAAITAQSCNNIIDKLERVAACRTGALCLK